MIARRTLYRQVGLIVILTALAKVAAFAKDVLLSLLFGAGPQTDAYFVANTIPGFIFGGVFATIGMVFLPLFKRAMYEGEREAADTYRTATIGYTVLSFLLGCITFLGAGIIVSIVAPDLPQQTRDLAVMMTRIMALSFVFSGWVGLQNTVLQSHKQLIWPQVVQVLSHAFVIGGLALAVLTGGPITLLVYAAVLGWIVLAHLVSLRARTYWPKARGARFDRRIASSLAALSFPVFLSLSLDQASILVGTALASSYPEGGVSHLNYASRLMMLLSSVFSLVIAYVLFPYLSESIVTNNTEKTRRYMLQALVAVLILSAPLSVLSLFMAEPLIAFVFQRGAFGAGDAAATGQVLQFFAPVIVLAGVREILNRLFLASQQTRALLIFGVLAMSVNVGASIYFSGRMGLEGIALGNTCGALVYVLAQIVLILGTQRTLIHNDLPIWLGIISGAAALAGLAGLWIDPLLTISDARLDFLMNTVILLAVFGTAIGGSLLLSARLRTIFVMEGTD